MGRRGIEFFEGDIVRVKSHVAKYSDLEGYVTEVNGFEVTVRISGKSLTFDNEELILILSPNKRGRGYR